MLFDFKFPKCIICCDKPANSKEHIIPDCLGGKLKHKILCGGCNSKFGSKYVSQLHRDPAIIDSLIELEDLLPELNSRLRDTMRVVGEAVNRSPINLKRKDGRPNVGYTELNDGSIAKNDVATRQELKRKMEQKNFSIEEINDFLTEYNNLSINTPIITPYGDTIIKRIGTKCLYPTQGEICDNKTPLLIAYEFLSLIIGETIYDKYFDDLRIILTGDCTSIPEGIVIRQEKTSNPRPVHNILLLNRADNCIEIIVSFFDKLIFRLNFYNICSLKDSFCYTQELSGLKREFIQMKDQTGKIVEYYI